MTDLHAKLDVLEGELAESLAGAAASLFRRAFGVLTLTRGDGTSGVGEASPLPGYSPDSIEDAGEELQRLTETPVQADPLASPHELLSAAFEEHPCTHPSSRFALEVALLDWLGHTREAPLHRLLGGDAERDAIPIARLVMESDPAKWESSVDVLVASGATHVKLKVGADIDKEIRTLAEVRRAHPKLAIRLDANQRLPPSVLRPHAAALEAVELELFEEPVEPRDWDEVLSLPLPFALDESLREPTLAARLFETGRIRAAVLKPMVLGGLRASFEIAELAAVHGADCLVSHTFDGPIGRAATAELALALQTPLAAGLGLHPALVLWPPHSIAAIRDGEIVPHDVPGIGLRFEEDADA